MQADQVMIFSLIALMLILFIWGKWRYDIVAILVLLMSAFLGLVPMSHVFDGFSNPAVITVAAVLIVSKGLTNAGVVDFITKFLSKSGDQTMVQMTLLVLTVTLGSAFMNNIGALALTMPVALKIARKNKVSPSIFLMPLAFGSLLGGMTTLIGTPPNIIISMYRDQATNQGAFTMFDFIPVGGGVALAGLIYILLLGWRLIPNRQGGKASEDLFEINDYITEVMISEGSTFVDATIADIENAIEGDLKVVSVVRNSKTMPVPQANFKLMAHDSVVVEAAAQDFKDLLNATDLELAETSKSKENTIQSDQVEVIEAVVVTNSFLIGKTAKQLKLRARYGINLLGVAREGTRIKNTPDTIVFRIGDLLLLQGHPETLLDLLGQWGCLPLAERGLSLSKNNKLLAGVALFATAITLTAFGLIPVQVAFVAVATLMVMAKFLTLKEVYQSVDWSIIVLLGAIIPVSQALETTGGAQLIADQVLVLGQNLPLWASIAIVLIVSMTLSDIVNNAAAVLIMAPIALEIALGLDVSADAFLMAVAIGASCSFLTPIGHQSNTLVMGPGGYKFGDYWKMGLPLEVIVVLVATPLIMLAWL